MSPVTEVLRQKLRTRLINRSRWCVAFSGGLDSTVLLHAMCVLRGAGNDGLADIEVRALHVNHGLHPMADQWAAHCETVCRELDVPLQVAAVTIEPGNSDGPEAAARQARYAAFASTMGQDEHLLTAHHQDDQVETVLLRLMRGAGTGGLAGISECGQFGSGWLLRPLLELSRRDLEACAHSAGLIWIDDPSNTDTSFDRNYLRHAVVPVLRERWPGTGKTIGRAARLSAESASLLDVLARDDCRSLLRGDAVDLAGLRRLAPDRQRNVVRHILKRRGLRAPTETQLRVGLESVLTARSDRQPILQWGGAQMHRYRDRLYFLDFDPVAESASLPSQYSWDANSAIDMGSVRGRLRLVGEPSGGLAMASAADGIVLRFRQGGERIRTANHGHHRLLKKLFQERGVLPWMRHHVPLLYGPDTEPDRSPGRLLAVGDLWIAADAVAPPGDSGYRILWEQHAPTG